MSGGKSSEREGRIEDDWESLTFLPTWEVKVWWGIEAGGQSVKQME